MYPLNQSLQEHEEQATGLPGVDRHPLKKLLQEHAPNGVEFVELGEVCEIITKQTGFDYSKTIKQALRQESSDDTYPYMQSRYFEGTDINFKTDYFIPISVAKCFKQLILDTPTLLISLVGKVGNVGFFDGNPIVFAGGNMAVCKLKHGYSGQFIMYFFQSKMGQKYLLNNANKASHLNITVESVRKILIPLPPLIVQEKIVTILDCFTELSAELSAELTARKKQYAYYLNALLDFGEPLLASAPSSQGHPMRATKEIQHALLKTSFRIEWVELGEIGEFIRGTGLTKADLQPDNPSGAFVGAIHYGQIHTYYNIHTTRVKSYVCESLGKKLRKVKTGDIVIVGVSEDVAGVCKAVAYLGDEDICIGGDTFAFRHQQNPKFIAYLLQTQDFLRFKQQYAHGAKVIRVSVEALKRFKIPLPPLPIQSQIVDILDQFHTLTTDLQAGLPAEIQARQKQYHYYLNALLEFDSK
ncbi:restriction endonuclease subunit S [Helicobacter sp. L8]|uniref:restriction endonuclease subunit S n=1 Tax=Helicobacter sp. L8 TaxID=2316078 RepID=UPI000EB470D3|nr:restriction endonuclease subunit S [Helicobacter sp. L8]